MPPFCQRIIVIVGPTAGGKSDLAVGLGQRLIAAGAVAEAAVLSADSMQVYRHLDAGTAKPSPALRAALPHHLIDIIEPHQRFTVADWLTLAQRHITALQQRGGLPIIVGGTNLYLKALLEGLFDAPSHDPATRQSLEALDPATLHAKLAAVDPEAAQRIHRNDHKKLVRALEVFTLTGQPISAMQQQWAVSRPYHHDPIMLGLEWPVEMINRRINARVKAMFYPPDEGQSAIVESLPAEVARLESAGLLGPPDAQARQALGYKQVLAAMTGRMSMDEAFEQTKILTRRYAKTQRTWLRRYRQVHWLAAEDGVQSPALVDAACEMVGRRF